jgi:protein disulfide-isomerase A1
MLASAVLSTEWEYEESVLVLTEDNFDKALQEFPTILAEFYAPWCGHCNALAPEYAAAAKQLEENQSPVKLAKIDATVHRNLGERYEVQGFPTLKFFHDGNIIDYDGDRTSDAILKWIEKRTGNPTKEVQSMDEVEAMKEDNVVVAYWGPENENYKIFVQVAQVFDDAVFVYNFDHTKFVENPSVIVYKNFDEGIAVYPSEITDVDELL